MTRCWITDLLLVGPAAIAVVLFIFLPVGVVFVLAFTDYQFGATTANWVGLENFGDLFGSRLGRNAIINTLIYAGIVIPASVGLGLLVAIGLHSLAKSLPRVSNVIKAVYFLPVAATLVAMAVSWQMLMHPSLGLFNTWASALGLSTQQWLSDRDIVLYSLAVIGVWQSVGYNMVLFLAGLASIPDTLYDASEVDGAENGWSKFWLVTWPMLGPTTLFVLIVTAASAFRVFETVATMTEGGPAFASDTIVYALYREGFVYFKAGYASAITVVFFFALLLITAIQLLVIERRVHYR
ncbi:ABC transporter permease subunit [Roseobacter sp. HKCCD9010]|uniref:carbohydrate ABC transporter permease n=1 Tax=unclassified Roseobacter TaxID=196798 RepID=UPI001490ABB9|nr:MULTISPECIES: sugar ABC transporter permease [unclassified Roseobacter]MBF9052443.1 ABC transporter permease subunit [Rhodobacterales bacterium HKCCD4356]NNV14367.1 ABC transporter permease subunit [Roseobacter sp. HKCCD7357]NNV18610.1 ABC transporter permease subunit [Roseobacter sp. HKCCD8768]NNV28030.1 ABC transporter permease subunit [Roseobacter sp. HKCCD8192]NNV32339.1 ABC transporter permease subunit [Roseobacter sp. HKCCD9061]